MPSRVQAFQSLVLKCDKPLSPFIGKILPEESHVDGGEIKQAQVPRSWKFTLIALRENIRKKYANFTHVVGPGPFAPESFHEDVEIT